MNNQATNAAGVPLWRIENLTTLEYAVVAAATSTEAWRTYEDGFDFDSLSDDETLDGNLLIEPVWS